MRSHPKRVADRNGVDTDLAAHARHTICEPCGSSRQHGPHKAHCWSMASITITPAITSSSFRQRWQISVAPLDRTAAVKAATFEYSSISSISTSEMSIYAPAKMPRLESAMGPVRAFLIAARYNRVKWAMLAFLAFILLTDSVTKLTSS